MTLRGFAAAAGVEWSKVTSQRKTQLALAACAVSPFVFAATMLVQSSLPEDTLFGRSVKDSGFAVPLVVLGFGGLWAFPALASLVAGDIFSAEDRYGTWTTLLSRSRSRTEIFVGKLAVALAFASLAVAILGISSVAAGAIVIGPTPLIDLSGTLVPAPHALVRVALAWLSVLPPVLAFSAAAILTSIATRSSVAGIGVPVVAGLAMQLYALVDGPELARWLLISSAFSGWHGWVSEPPYHRPVLYGTLTSALYFAVFVTCAYRLLERRDVVR